MLLSIRSRHDRSQRQKRASTECRALQATRTLLPGAVQIGGADAARAAGRLHDGAAERLARGHARHEAQGALAADGGGFNGGAGLHQSHQRDDAIIRKVDRIDHVSWIIEERALFQRDRG